MGKVKTSSILLLLTVLGIVEVVTYLYNPLHAAMRHLICGSGAPSIAGPVSRAVPPTWSKVAKVYWQCVSRADTESGLDGRETRVLTAVASARESPNALLGVDVRLLCDHLLEALQIRHERRLIHHAHLADDRCTLFNSA